LEPAISAAGLTGVTWAVELDPDGDELDELLELPQALSANAPSVATAATSVDRAKALWRDIFSPLKVLLLAIANTP
jgi:hypothetical protein